jgi:hypothetical protein
MSDGSGVSDDSVDVGLPGSLKGMATFEAEGFDAMGTGLWKASGVNPGLKRILTKSSLVSSPSGLWEARFMGHWTPGCAWTLIRKRSIFSCFLQRGILAGDQEQGSSVLTDRVFYTWEDFPWRELL